MASTAFLTLSCFRLASSPSRPLVTYRRHGQLLRLTDSHPGLSMFREIMFVRAGRATLVPEGNAGFPEPEGTCRKESVSVQQMCRFVFPVRLCLANERGVRWRCPNQEQVVSKPKCDSKSSFLAAAPPAVPLAIRLARDGQEVALIERSRYETQRIGELLPPIAGIQLQPGPGA